MILNTHLYITYKALYVMKERGAHLIDLIDAAEEWLARVHLGQHAAQAPHVDRHRVRQAQHHLLVPENQSRQRSISRQEWRKGPVGSQGRLGESPYLWGAVEAALDVRVHALVGAARGAEVDHLDARALGVPQQDVLRLEVTVDDIHLRKQTHAKAGQLLRHERRLLSHRAIRRDMWDGGMESGSKWRGSF